MSVSSIIGKKGEDTAARYLSDIGLTVLEKNYRSSMGEIDLIARGNDSLVFIEVKSWQGLESESLEHALNRKKIGRIIHTAKRYVAEHADFDTFAMRFDVILIDPVTQRVDHIEHAFTENDC